MGVTLPWSDAAMQTAYRFLEIANRHFEVRPLLLEFAAELKHATGCSAVGIRLKDPSGGIPYTVYDGFSREFYDLENPLNVGADACMCSTVISGRTDATKGFFTPGGSFWINDATQFLATVSEDEKGRTRNACHAFGYESIALIPIKTGRSILGLIHLADERTDMVSADTVYQLEQAAMVLGNAIQRVRLTQSLRDSEERSRALFDNASDAIILWEKTGTDFRIIEVNRVACDRYGYSHDEMLGLTTRDLNTAASAAMAGDITARLAEGGSATYQVIHRTRTGTVIPSEVSGHLFRLGDKTVVLSVVRDIRERLGRETEMRRLASFPLSNPNPVLRLSPEANILFANPAAAPLLKEWRAAEGGLLPAPWPDLARTAYNDNIKHETEFQCCGATYALTLFPDVENGFLNLYALDITRRKSAETALKESRDYLEKLNDSLPETIITVRRPEKLIEYANGRVEQMYGYLPGECLGRTPEFLFPGRGAYLTQSRRVSDAIRRGTSAEGLRTELVQKRKNGELFPCEVIQNFIPHPDGTISVISIIRDISRLKETQAEIEGYHQRLEEMVSARTEALNFEITQRQKAETELRALYEREQTLSGALRQQIEERSLFTHALVHELKTPLTPLLTASDFLETSLQDETSRGFARNIKLGARNMEKRINEMLDLARGEVGTLKLSYRNFQLADLMTEIADYIRPETVRRGQKLHLELPTRPVPMQADPDRLRQVMLNLLNNSLKFTRRAGVIRLSATLEPDGAVITVADNGSGIAPSDLPYIFQPYHRGQQSDKNRLGGLGLGLVLSKMIVELHGGQMWLKSAVGKGSTFNFKIPYKKL